MIKYITKPYYLFCICIIVFSACIREGENLCPTYGSRIKVITGTFPGIQIPHDVDIKDINLYIFNEAGYLIGNKQAVELNQWIELDYPNAGKLHAIAIANASDVDINLSNPTPDCHISQNAFGLNQARKFDSKQLYATPGEVFYGNIIVDNTPTIAEEKTLPILPVVSKINIKVKGHQEYALHTLDLPTLPAINEFRFVVETKHITVDFMGKPCGNPVYYDCKELVANQEICELPTFNMLSTLSGEEVIILFYHKETLIDTITETNQINSRSINSLITQSGKLLEVYINYQSGLTASLLNANWSQGELLWKDF